MFGHSTRNAFALVASNCRFLNDDTYGCMVTRYGPFPKIQIHEHSNGNRVLQPLGD